MREEGREGERKLQLNLVSEISLAISNSSQKRNKQIKTLPQEKKINVNFMCIFIIPENYLLSFRPFLREKHKMEFSPFF